MSLTEGDKAICAEIAGEVIEKVLDRHIVSCPHGLALIKSRVFLVGACVGSGFGSGGVVVLVAKILGIF